MCVGQLLAWKRPDRKCVMDDQTEAKVEIPEKPAARKATQAKNSRKKNPEQKETLRITSTETHTHTDSVQPELHNSPVNTHSRFEERKSHYKYLCLSLLLRRRKHKEVASRYVRNV